MPEDFLSHPSSFTKISESPESSGTARWSYRVTLLPREKQDFNGTGKIFYSSDFPNKLLRQMSTVLLYEDLSLAEKNARELELANGEIKNSKTVLNDLAQSGVRIPKHDYLICKNPEDSGLIIYQAVDKIEGVNLDKITELAPQDLEKFDNYFAAIAYYLESKIVSGQPCIDSLYKPEQTMWGKAPGSSENELFMVDLDPSESTLFSVKQAVMELSYLWTLCVKNLEAKFEPEAKMVKARAEIIKAFKAALAKSELEPGNHNSVQNIINLIQAQMDSAGHIAAK